MTQISDKVVAAILSAICQSCKALVRDHHVSSVEKGRTGGSMYVCPGGVVISFGEMMLPR